MQKLFSNKKGDVGDSSQQLLFFLAELIIGGILIAGGTYQVIAQIGSADTEVITKDLALLISSISHQTEDLSYTYLIPEYVTYISISDKAITIHSDKGSSTAKISKRNDIKIQDITFVNPDSIPILFSYSTRVLNFESEELATSCGNLRLLSKTTQFEIETKGTREEEIILNQLKTYLEQMRPTENLFTERLNTPKLEISFNTENNYIISIPSEPQYGAIKCYFETMFQGIENTPFDRLIIQENNQNKIELKIGTYQAFNELTTKEQDDLLLIYATNTFESIIRGRER